MHQSCSRGLPRHIREDEQGRAKMGKRQELVRGKWKGSGGRIPYFASGRAVFRPEHAPSRWSSPGDRQGYVAEDRGERLTYEDVFMR